MSAATARMAAANPQEALLLASPEVRNELRLSPDLQDQVKGLLDRAVKLERGGSSSEETSPDRLRLSALKLLKPRQTLRLRQIGLQRAAAFVLNDPGFARRLGVKEDQAARVREAQNKENLRRLVQAKQYERNPSPAAQARWRTMEAEHLVRCRAILDRELTEIQRRRLQAYLGKPFEGEITYDVAQPTMARA